MPRMFRAGVRSTAGRDPTTGGDRVLAVSRLSRRVASPSHGLPGAADWIERAPLDGPVGSASTKLAFSLRCFNSVAGWVWLHLALHPLNRESDVSTAPKFSLCAIDRELVAARFTAIPITFLIKRAHLGQPDE